MSRRRRGVGYSETLLEGDYCLWLGFRVKASDYQNVILSISFLKERALAGHMGTIVEAGLFGAEVEFSVTHGRKDKISLCLDVSELLPLTKKEATELLIKHIDEGESSVSTQTQTKKSSTYKCSERGCSHVSPSPQGLGTHKVRTHNLQSQRGIRKVAITSTRKAESGRTTSRRSTSTSVSTTSNWKSQHDALLKKYNRLSTRYNSLVGSLRKIGTQYTSV